MTEPVATGESIIRRQRNKYVILVGDQILVWPNGKLRVTQDVREAKNLAMIHEGRFVTVEEAIGICERLKTRRKK